MKQLQPETNFCVKIVFLTLSRDTVVPSNWKDVTIYIDIVLRK